MENNINNYKMKHDVVTLEPEFQIELWIAASAFKCCYLIRIMKIGKSIFRQKCEEFSHVVTLEPKFEI